MDLNRHASLPYGDSRWAMGVFLAAVVLATPPGAAGQTNPKPASGPAAGQNSQKVSPELEESQALSKAFEEAAGDPQALIKNLEDFLVRFPNSPRRGQVLRTIFNQALRSNNPRKAIEYAEKALALSPEDSALLSALVDLLDRQGDAAAREEAIGYATRFIEHTKKDQQQTGPAGPPPAKGEQTQALFLATGYAMRAKLWAESGKDERATADYEKSFAAYPTALVAERLGDLAAKAGKGDRAISEYATAFAFPEQNLNLAHREELRRKLGSAYVAEHHTEKGLGDRILARYDELARSQKSRAASQDEPNAGLSDPLEFVLMRPDGSALRLSDFRGKVLVMDFWATWCGPCRVAGKLFDQVKDEFRNEPRAAFLAVNVDEERDAVRPFVKAEGWTAPVVYAQGLDRILDVRALPTFLIFGRDGRVIFRMEGVDPPTFSQTIAKKIVAALEHPASTAATSR